MAIDAAPGLTAGFDYELPSHLIASRPAERRDASRLLVLSRATGDIEDARFADLPRLLSPGDALVLNDTRVFPARLLGRKPTGARAEILLTRPFVPSDDAPGSEGTPASDHDPLAAFRSRAPRVWEAIVRPGGKLKPGRRVEVGEGFEVEILDSRPDGSRVVRLTGEADPWTLIERHGHVPLPPYIERPDDATDRRRYQTVYARETGSVAAPTAGLHFTAGLLDRVREAGVETVTVTLHVGVGTFRPVSAERIDEHRLHAEAYRITGESADVLNRVRASGGRVWAVGTTTCRVLESVADPGGRYGPRAGWTDLFIHPPYRFRGIDALITNFHLPRSSLLMLVAALAGTERVLGAYRHAVAEGYRFYSYGDAMVVA